MRPTKAEALPRDEMSPLADPAARLAARLIDFLAQVLPALVLVPLGIVIGSSGIIRAGFYGVLVTTVVLVALNVWWLHRYGQTLGKRLLGLRIVRTSGERAGLARILGLRVVLTWALSAIPYLGWAFALVNPLLVFSFNRQCIHDRFADTMVVDLRTTPPRA